MAGGVVHPHTQKCAIKTSWCIVPIFIFFLSAFVPFRALGFSVGILVSREVSAEIEKCAKIKPPLGVVWSHINNAHSFVRLDSSAVSARGTCRPNAGQHDHVIFVPQ